MAGGLFPAQPFSWNLKCIVFTAAIAGGYWYLPSKRTSILLLLLWLPYVAMAWYDYSYDCKDKMQPTIFPYGRYVFLPFKPKGYQAQFDKLPKEQVEQMDKVDHTVTWTIAIAALSYVLLRPKNP